MESPNPYQPPSRDGQSQRHPDLPDGWFPCPQCRGSEITQTTFTWWGGALGPRMLNHVKCQSCGTTFNAKTGKSNLPAIIVYQVVVIAVTLAILYAIDVL